MRIYLAKMYEKGPLVLDFAECVCIIEMVLYFLLLVGENKHLKGTSMNSLKHIL